MIAFSRQDAPYEFTSLRSPQAQEQHDAQLLASTRRSLETSGYRELAELNCEVIDGLVVLEGVVPSYYLKQLAQEAVLSLGEADGVRNLVAVHWPRT